MATGTIKKNIVVLDSNVIEITAEANSNAIKTINLNKPTGAEIVSYTVITNSVSGSWNVQLSYLSKFNAVSFYNYGTSANTWNGYVRAAYIL